jgi:hypothetical protein
MVVFVHMPPGGLGEEDVDARTHNLPARTEGEGG